MQHTWRIVSVTIRSDIPVRSSRVRGGKKYGAREEPSQRPGRDILRNLSLFVCLFRLLKNSFSLPRLADTQTNCYGIGFAPGSAGQPPLLELSAAPLCCFSSQRTDGCLGSTSKITGVCEVLPERWYRAEPVPQGERQLGRENRLPASIETAAMTAPIFNAANSTK
ncbi:unnamed protein product [Arctogadus glacialis]